MDQRSNCTTKTLAAIALIGASHGALANCWQEASVTYNIPVAVLAAVAKTESGFNPRAVNVNANGTRDLGLMQINDSHLQNLAQRGIGEPELFDACTNLKVGAWILSQNATRLGWNWNAIGAYNVGCKKLDAQECQRRRVSYATKVHAALKKIGAPSRQAVAVQTPSLSVATPAGSTIMVFAATEPAATAVGSGVTPYSDATLLTARYVAPSPIPNEAAKPIHHVRFAESASIDDGDDEEPGNDWYNHPERISHD